MNQKLTKYKLVCHDGMTGVNYKGRNIPLERIDDKLADELYGKTHVLERLPDTEPATAPVVLALAEPAAEAEAPASTSRRAR